VIEYENLLQDTLHLNVTTNFVNVNKKMLNYIQYNEAMQNAFSVYSLLMTLADLTKRQKE